MKNKLFFITLLTLLTSAKAANSDLPLTDTVKFVLSKAADCTANYTNYFILPFAGIMAAVAGGQIYLNMINERRIQLLETESRILFLEAEISRLREINARFGNVPLDNTFTALIQANNNTIRRFETELSDILARQS